MEAIPSRNAHAKNHTLQTNPQDPPEPPDPFNQRTKKGLQTKLLRKSSPSGIKSVLKETKNNDVDAMLYLARMLLAALK